MREKRWRLGDKFGSCYDGLGKREKTVPSQTHIPALAKGQPTHTHESSGSQSLRTLIANQLPLPESQSSQQWPNDNQASHLACLPEERAQSVPNFSMPHYELGFVPSASAPFLIPWGFAEDRKCPPGAELGFWACMQKSPPKTTAGLPA